MDFATVIGLLLGILSLLMGFILEGGSIAAILQGTAALIVFGGTFGAVIASFPFRVLKRIPFILKYAFFEKPFRPEETIEQLVDLANISRREGLLALEGRLEENDDNKFLQEGIQMVVDGAEAEMIEDILNREIERYEENILSVARVFEAAGGFAPTMGIIGTVMGLVHVLGDLNNPETLGPSIAVAFIATLYGVSSANLIYLPIFNKIKARLEQDILLMELQAEGLMSIQLGENTTILRNKLQAFLDKHGRQKNRDDGPLGEADLIND
ncbi:flagellar motor protein [Caenibacillus caldisaponilyticus]|jgi:chemotaxis protein MotA|uniref:flagellar motor protein n=1 Tax=Caenibacillus caldisaponilyticus TaxID=1674942 RepID=UPI0009887040|nr:flagellar motor protein [Caenibacillus caldisaponilyticus]